MLEDSPVQTLVYMKKLEASPQEFAFAKPSQLTESLCKEEVLDDVFQ
jgi:hypothetical protein